MEKDGRKSRPPFLNQTNFNMKYHRPKTRGELRDKIKEGVECEVVGDNTGTTVSLLNILDFEWGVDYDIKFSENAGWAVFYKID